MAYETEKTEQDVANHAMYWAEAIEKVADQLATTAALAHEMRNLAEVMKRIARSVPTKTEGA
jgi:hypothetical protein